MRFVTLLGLGLLLTPQAMADEAVAPVCYAGVTTAKESLAIEKTLAAKCRPGDIVSIYVRLEHDSPAEYALLCRLDRQVVLAEDRLTCVYAGKRETRPAS